MDDDVDRWFNDFDTDLKEKKDRSSDIDELFQYSFMGDTEIKQRTSWCLAKMGQNKVSDMRILDILVSMACDADGQVRENVAWGIGEVTGAGIGDDRSVYVVVKLMDDDEKDVRAMAAWAAGRLKHKIGIKSKSIDDRLVGLLEDSSEYVKKAARFALDG